MTEKGGGRTVAVGVWRNLEANATGVLAVNGENVAVPREGVYQTIGNL